jgi:phenol 2-monooxygenase
MPVYRETSSAARDLRILPSRAFPLPRLSPVPDVSGTEEKREIVVIGVSELTIHSTSPLLTLPF